MRTTRAILVGKWRYHLATSVLATALLGWTVSVARGADPITDANVNAAVAAATTPEDHLALAAFFTAKAEAALASAENHDKMVKAFGPSKSGALMAPHCRSLASTDRKRATDYTALAKGEDALAKGTAGGKHNKHQM